MKQQIMKIVGLAYEVCANTKYEVICNYNASTGMMDVYVDCDDNASGDWLKAMKVSETKDLFVETVTPQHAIFELLSLLNDGKEIAA